MPDPDAFTRDRIGMGTFEMKRKASFSKLTCPMERPTSSAYDDAGADGSLPIENRDKMWKLMSKYLSTDMATIQRAIVNHVEYTLIKNRWNMDDEACYHATALSIRDRLVEMFNDTNQFFFSRDFKRCYYLSVEYLMGRAMQNALISLDIEEQYRRALADLGYRLETLYEYEHDAGLGFGSRGRLAACFLDSMATSNYACWGYGIRYTYGVFDQKIVDGWQQECPDYWLSPDNPWECPRPDVTYAIRFGGEVIESTDDMGVRRFKWTGGQIIQAIAYDNIIPGFDTLNCLNLRLWRAAPSKEFDFGCFNEGRYLDAIKERQDAECISAVLYPNDSTESGKELRLKQQYFFVCATLQDVLRRFKKKPRRDWRELPKKMAIQLNDTHPTIGIPELIRILVDVENLPWDLAVSLSRQVFHLTNHTTNEQALEKWPASLIEKLLPRHIRIINDLNLEFLNSVRAAWGHVNDKIARMSVYEDRLIRMANLAVIGCRKVNGVATLQSDLIKRDLFPDFAEWYSYNGQPDKFINVTNGVTPRRWIHCANRLLSDLISSWLGSDTWLKDLDMMAGLLNHIDDDQLHDEWTEVKRRNKERLARWVAHMGGPKLQPSSQLFDIQVSHIDEYKRQHLNAFWMLHHYLALKSMTAEERANAVPRATLMGGKAGPNAWIAKVVIRLVVAISELVNNDPDIGDLYKVFFIPNCSVSVCQIVIPGADLCQHTSLPDSEASAITIMEFILNGALFLGTMDSATTEVIQEIGKKSAFLFGAGLQEVREIKKSNRNRQINVDGRLQEVFDFIRSGKLSKGCEKTQRALTELVDHVYHQDMDLVCHDFPDYCRAQTDVERTYKNVKRWVKMSVTAAASMGKFSSDRTIREYAVRVWNLSSAERPPPGQNQFRRLASGSGSPKSLPAPAGQETATMSVFESNEEIAASLIRSRRDALYKKL